MQVPVAAGEPPLEAGLDGLSLGAGKRLEHGRKSRYR